MNLAGLLDAAPEPGRRDDDALVHLGQRSATRGAVRADAEALATTLASAGVAAGEVVGVMLPNGVRSVSALFGVWSAGAVVVPLNPRLSDPELAHVLASVEPAAVVCTAVDADRFAGRVVVLADGGLDADDADRGPWTASGTRPADVPRHDADIALIQFTSGTTGRPKPVLLRHSGVLTLIDGVLAKLRGAGSGSGSGGAPAKAPMANLIPVSLSLWAGIYNVLFALRVGAPVVILPTFEPRAFADAVARHGIRSTVLPPAAMAMLCDDESVTDLAPLRFVRSITAPLSVLGAQRFRDRFGIAVLNSYGQTEIGGEIVGWNAADSRTWGDEKLGSVGRPHDGVELRTIGPDGTDVAPGEAGELWVRTPALSAGYADGTDLGDRLTEDGWFRTGDVGRVDADGFVWIEGRVSDMINRGGMKVYPAEVEEALRLHPSVADVAVVGVADERLGQVPVAFVVLAPGATLDAAALDAAARAHLAPYKVPVRFEALDELPRNEVGKVLKARLAGGA